MRRRKRCLAASSWFIARLVRLSAVSIWLAGSLPVWSQVDVSHDLETIRTNRHMPGILAMAIKKGLIVAQGATGYRRQGDSTPLLITDPVNLGSCTKWMTATIAGRLVDRGIIGWNTRVRDVFTNYPAFNPSFTNVTLDQLLCHYGGVENETTFEATHWTSFMSQTGSVSQLRRWVSDTVLKDAPQVPPGTYLYANQGYTVAATMMEIASGTDWETLIQQEVFTPVRMKSATLGQVFDNALPPKAPVGHDLAAGATNPVPRLKLPLNYELHYHAAVGPPGYVGCTLKDWAKFLRIHTTNYISDYMSSATGTRLQQPYIDDGDGSNFDMGRGILVTDRTWASPGKALAHGGDVFGQDSLVWMAPANDFITVAAINCSATNTAVGDALNDVATLLVLNYANALPNGPLLEDPAPSGLTVHDHAVLSYLTLPGLAYVVEITTNLHGNWAPANGANGQTAAGLVSSYTDSSLSPVKFFRVRAVP
jgi:CubicO group peptidase (beta-lactamase class C family)